MATKETNISIEIWKALTERLSENSLRLDIELTGTKRMLNDTISKCERLSAENEKLREKLNEAEKLLKESKNASEYEHAVDENVILRLQLAETKRWVKTLEKLVDDQLAECVRLHETIVNGVR